MSHSKLSNRNGDLGGIFPTRKMKILNFWGDWRGVLSTSYDNSVWIVQYVQAEYITYYGSLSTIVIPVGFIVWFPHVHNHQQQVDMSRISPLGKPSAFFSFLGITEISKSQKSQRLANSGMGRWFFSKYSTGMHKINIARHGPNPWFLFKISSAMSMKSRKMSGNDHPSPAMKARFWPQRIHFARCSLWPMLCRDCTQHAWCSLHWAYFRGLVSNEQQKGHLKMTSSSFHQLQLRWPFGPLLPRCCEWYHLAF